jgi:hypothetical protein
MTESSPYVIHLDELEGTARVPSESLVESQPEPAVPHDLLDEDMALGRESKRFGR